MHNSHQALPSSARLDCAPLHPQQCDRALLDFIWMTVKPTSSRQPSVDASCLSLVDLMSIRQSILLRTIE